MVPVESGPTVRISDAELADELRNGGNTRENQREAIERIVGSQPGMVIELLSAFELALRREGYVPDSQLATNVLNKNLP